MYDISKKAIVGSFIYIILSLPQVLTIMNKILPYATEADTYKNILLRAIIFSIVFVLIAKYL